MALSISILVMLLSVFLIWKSSDWMTDSLVPVAKKLGTSYIAITTLLVSLILSLPEIFTAVYALLLGHIEIGIGVVIGSVMANIGLIVGLSAILKPLVVDHSVIIRDGIFMIIIAVVVGVFGSDLAYSRSEGIVLLLLFIPYALNVWFFEKWRPRQHQAHARIRKNLALIGNWKRLKMKPGLSAFLFGGVVLLIGSFLFSYSLIEINDSLGLPEILVGLVFGAIGTGIPNIAAAIQGTLKGYKDAAITETFGSNIVTLLITLGIIIVISPFRIAGKVFYFDLTWMIVMNVLFLGLIVKSIFFKGPSLSRMDGVILLLFYLALLVIQFVYY